MKVLVFGEILYDVYNEEYIVGGASFNFCVQIARMIEKTHSVRMISAIGRDDLGQKALDFAQQEQIDISLIQRLKDFETGKALVFLNDTKIPDYNLVENVAWDNIAYTAQIDIALSSHYDIFYCNLLAQRFARSKATLLNIMQKVRAKFKVFDMTLRKHYYTPQQIRDTLHFTNVLKVNEEELQLINALFYNTFNGTIQQNLEKIRHDFTIPYIFLTLGEKGACLLSDNGFFKQKSTENIAIIDTLGAGDSFCAALSFALAHGNIEDKDILAFAMSVAEEIIQVQGGTAHCNLKKIKQNFLI